MKFLLLLALSLIGAQCSTHSLDPEGDRPDQPGFSTLPDAGPTEGSLRLPSSIQQVLTDYESAWAAKDEEALASLFVEDGFVLSNERPVVRGRSEIERRYRDSGGPLSLRPIAFGVDGDLGYVLGTYARDPLGPDLGKFTLVLSRSAGGDWLIVADMDNAVTRPEVD